MPRKLRTILQPLLAGVLFSVALWLIYRELHNYGYHQLADEVRRFPARRIAQAFALTVLSYAILTLYDTMALRYIRRQLSYLRTAMGSFLGYAFSHNVGFSALSAGAARYYAYSAWGFSGLDVAGIVVFSGLTLWLGFAVLSGVVFLLAPPLLPESLHLLVGFRVVGIILLAGASSYLGGAIFWRRPLRFRQWEFHWPSPRLAVAQAAVSTADWIAAALVFYVLLPHADGVTLPRVIGVFMAAQLLGLLSNIPGGLGVFEATVLLLLSPVVPKPALIGSLVLYRLVYYLIPLGAAILLLTSLEVLRRRERLAGAWRFTAGVMGSIIPPAFAVAVLVAGVVLLFSGATPAIHARLRWLDELLPDPLVETSHLLGSMIGACLLLLARGLQRRIRAAYTLTLAALLAGAVFSLLKGLDYEEAAFLTILALVLLPCGRLFYRSSSLIDERFTPGWIITIALAIGASIWLGFFSYKHVEYSNELWWRFELNHGGMPRFLRASLGVIVTVLLFSLMRLLRPARRVRERGEPPDPSLIAALVAQCPHTYASLALLGDKSVLLNAEGTGFLMYGAEGRSWVCMGDPVAAPDDQMGLIWQFRELCDRHYAWSVFYEVRQETLPHYATAGLTLYKIGEEARVPLAGFTLERPERKPLRKTRRQVEKQGCRFEVLPVEAVGGRLAEFRRISDEWLKAKKTREKGFSMGFFDESYVARFPAAVVFCGDNLVAFANLWIGGQHEELSPDLMRYSVHAPENIMEYLFISLMLWGAGQGYRWFNLGMAPLSGLENRPLAPLWNRLGSLLFQHGEHFYNFQGLRNYKEKFLPQWEPRFLACPAGAAITRILLNIAALTSGSVRGALTR